MIDDGIARRLFHRLPLPEPGKCMDGWPGAVNEHGYGIIGKTGSHKGTTRISRVAYEYFIGPIPDGLDVLHTCDNPPCCLPDHLFVGDAKANHEDSVAKGRHVPPPRFVGSKHPHAKLTEDDVRFIQSMYGDGCAIVFIAEVCQVSASTVSLIIHGKSWKHVS